MIISLHQPAYLPWLGYLEKVSRADVFIFLDSVQFGGKKDNFINRNKIKTSQGPQWLTIPVSLHGHSDEPLRMVTVDDSKPWRAKHLRSIELNYRRAPYFKECFSKLECLINTPGNSIVELCWQQLLFWLDEFDIRTSIIRSSELSISSKKSDLVLDICRQFGAHNYLSGPMGKDYLDTNSFASHGIEIVYQNFVHPVYHQLWGDFEPYMCIVDYWMNCGSGPLNFLKGDIHGV
jgi:hypothetical protein